MSNNTNKIFYKLSEQILTALYPWYCVMCRSRSRYKSVCQQCEACLPWCNTIARCSICALPLPAGENLVCGQCQQKPPYYDHIDAVFWYQTPIKEFITEYKYSSRWEHARTLVALSLQSFVLASDNALVVPVPSHATRVKQRGFNAVYELLKLLRKHHRFAYDDTLVERVKNTETQTGKTKAQRRRNLRSAFKINTVIPMQRVVIVDEVVTTGATVNELSRCLKKAGVKQVSVWAVARTIVK